MKRSKVLIAVWGFALMLGGLPGVTRAATPTAILSVSPSSGTAATSLQVGVYLTTPSEGVSFVKARVSYSSALQFTSMSMVGSVFPEAVSGPTASSGSVDFERALFTAGGYTGTNGLVALLTFTVISDGPATVSISKADSLVTAYSDSTDVLASVSNGSYTVTTTAPTSTPAPTPTGAATPAPVTSTPTPAPTVIPTTSAAPVAQNSSTDPKSAIAKTGDTTKFVSVAALGLLILSGLGYVLVSRKHRH